MQGMTTRIILLIIICSLQTHAKVKRYTFRQQCSMATEIFVGRVISLQTLKVDSINNTWRTIAKVVRLHNWKGNVQDTITYIAQSSIACCGSGWTIDNNFLIYTTDNKFDCAGRTWFADDNKDIFKLNIKYRHWYRRR